MLYIYFYRKINFLLIRLYIIVQCVIYLFPFIFYNYFYLDENFEHPFYFVHPLHDLSLFPYYQKSMVYILCFDGILFVSIYFLLKIKPIIKSNETINELTLEKLKLINIKLFYIVMFFMFFLTDIILFQNGSISLSKIDSPFSFLQKGFLPNSVVQPLKIISNLKYPFFLFMLHYNSAIKTNLKKHIIILFLYLLFFGVIISSRYYVILPCILLIYSFRKIIKNHIKKFIFLGVIISFFLLMLFPMLNLMRQDTAHFSAGTIDNTTKTYVVKDPVDKIKYYIYAKLYEQELRGRQGFEKAFFMFFDNILEISSGRLNYLIINAKIIKHVETKKTIDSSYYNNNFISLVPRILWPSKPIITNHSDFLAQKIGIFEKSFPKKNLFAVGLRPIGESFLVFEWKGLFLSVFVAIFFYVVCYVFSKSVFGYSFFTFYSFELVKHDSFHAVIPGFLHFLIGFLIFYIICQIFIKISKSSLKNIVY